jgi:hypothetical protein
MRDGGKALMNHFPHGIRRFNHPGQAIGGEDLPLRVIDDFIQGLAAFPRLLWRQPTMHDLLHDLFITMPGTFEVLNYFTSHSSDFPFSGLTVNSFLTAFLIAHGASGSR